MRRGRSWGWLVVALRAAAKEITSVGPGRGSFPCRQGGVLIRPRKPGATLRFARTAKKRGHAGTADHHMRAGGIQERNYLLYVG